MWRIKHNMKKNAALIFVFKKFIKRTCKSASKLLAGFFIVFSPNLKISWKQCVYNSLSSDTVLLTVLIHICSKCSTPGTLRKNQNLNKLSKWLSTLRFENHDLGILGRPKSHWKRGSGSNRQDSDIPLFLLALSNFGFHLNRSPNQKSKSSLLYQTIS
jgi:hypothetical protein